MTQLKERVLKYCNKFRKELGLKERKRLSKGRKCVGTLCPIARTLKGKSFHACADPREIYYYDRNFVPDLMKKPPGYIKNFMHDFDTGKYPELEKK